MQGGTGYGRRKLDAEEPSGDACLDAVGSCISSDFTGATAKNGVDSEVDANGFQGALQTSGSQTLMAGGGYSRVRKLGRRQRSRRERVSRLIGY